MPEGGHDRNHNGELSGEIAGFVDRLERIVEEKKAAAKDFTDVLENACNCTGLSKAAFRNILRERSRSRSEVHAVYTDMDAIRRALKMRDPLLPVEDEDDEPGPTRQGADTFTQLGDALDFLHRREREPGEIDPLLEREIAP